MKTVLIDASIVVTALLEENLKVENCLKRLLKKVESGSLKLISSKLINLEATNALRFGINDDEKCLKVWKDFVSLPIRTYILTKGQLNLAIKYSYLHNTTVYDTSYHVLAISKGAVFLTCDHKYFRKAKGLGSIELVG